MSSKNKQFSNFIKKRQKRLKVLGGFIKFTRGDILAVTYRLHGMGFNFTGICIRVTKKSMLQPNTSFSLRNILGKVAVEIKIALYSLGRASYKILDYARKKMDYKKAKLYYLRLKANKESWVNS